MTISINNKLTLSQRLREELVSVAQNAPWTAINELPRLDAVMKEIMRLYPSAPMTLRTLHKDHSIAGYLVPEGFYFVQVTFFCFAYKLFDI